MAEMAIYPFDWKKLKKKTTFKPRARIVRLLGEELISSEIIAFTELIKNAHDADTTVVKIDFTGLTEDQSIISIVDNGDGMDEDYFLNEWLQFGGSWKRDKLFTRKGRPLLGQMGIGRFAADKLASRLYLISRARGNASELHAYFDWDRFDPHSTMLSDLKVCWDLRKPVFFTGKRHGTQLILTGLKNEWSEDKLSNLKTSLSSIVHPFGNLGKFDIRISSTDYPSMTGSLNKFAFDNAHYIIKAHLDYDGIVSYQLENGNQNAFLWKENGGLRTGPISVSIFAWDLEKRKDIREPISYEMRQMLKQWNGMLIFRDGFRVWPYGRNGNDWMGLDRRRVDDPTGHLGNNQVIGLISISSRHNLGLRDLSNREGMRETEALSDLKELIQKAVLPPLEKHRKNIRKRRQLVLIQNELRPAFIDKYKAISNSKKRLRYEVSRVEKLINKRKKELSKLTNYKEVLKNRLLEVETAE